MINRKKVVLGVLLSGTLASSMAFGALDATAESARRLAAAVSAPGVHDAFGPNGNVVGVAREKWDDDDIYVVLSDNFDTNTECRLPVTVACESSSPNDGVGPCKLNAQVVGSAKCDRR